MNISLNLLQNVPKYSCLEWFGIIGLTYYTNKLVLSSLRGLWTCFLAQRLGFGVRWRPADNVWAVITGGTDGIGLEYAKQLAQKGYSIMIISRSEGKLDAVAKQIKDENPKCKQVNTIAVDFSRTDIYDIIAKELSKLDFIDVLVNNVGSLHKTADYFTLIDSESNNQVMNINMTSMTRMLEIVLPKMVGQKRGIIINVSSQTALTPVPLMSIYSATKAFVGFLSEAVSVEYESKGIIIQTFVPSLVKTKLAYDLKDSFFAITPRDCVSAALNTVGIESITYGHWKHRLIANLGLTVGSIVGHRRSMRLGFNILKPVRDDYYRKNGLTDPLN